MVSVLEFTLHADKQGRIMLPSKWRKDAGIRPSTELRAVVDESGVLILETREQALRRARALVRKYVAEGVRLSDELVAERRREAAREAGRS